MKRKLLILDLDETLIHATEEPLSVAHDFTYREFYVYKRPGVEEFLRFCGEYFDVAVWTTSREDYALAIVEDLFDAPDGLVFMWARNRCVLSYDPDRRGWQYVKDLRRLNRFSYAHNQIIGIDDTANKYQRQPTNLIHIEPFLGGQHDRELPYLTGFLAYLQAVSDVQAIDKTNWREVSQELSAPRRPDLAGAVKTNRAEVSSPRR